MLKAKQLGRKGEYLVSKFLKQNGFVVMKTGISTPGIDILAFKDGWIYLYEVKYIIVKTPLLRLPNELSKQLQNLYNFKTKLLEEGFNVKVVVAFVLKVGRKHHLVEVVEPEGINHIKAALTNYLNDLGGW